MNRLPREPAMFEIKNVSLAATDGRGGLSISPDQCPVPGRADPELLAALTRIARPGIGQPNSALQ